MLKESEWKMINNILLELYMTESIEDLASKFFKIIKTLIQYTSGYMLLLDKNKNIIINKIVSENMEERIMRDYINIYYKQDYLNYLYDLTNETVVYRDTDILDESIRKETNFYRNFLEPGNFTYGCGIIMIRNSDILGIFNIFRNKDIGDFTEKDIYILNIFKNHIENIVSKALKVSENAKINNIIIDEISQKYELTAREKEILIFLVQGYSNKDISEKLCISLATVKTHIYNLYIKTGVKSRTGLIKLILEI